MKIGVLILFEVLIQIFGIERDGLIDEIKVNGISRQNENMDRENVIESFGSPNSYEERSMFADINPFLYNNMMKRSPIDRNTGRRQTGIIYGDGKPIGILQPYDESFKFMPIKEEKVYALDGGRSDLNEQEPYLNLMYPLARFARSEDALKMAEYEAARAEFLEKHYPSMLVDFKIRDKLHANRAKSTHQEVKREEQNSDDMEKFEQKRQLELASQNTGKRESEPTQKKPTQKREAEKPMKRDIENDQTADSSKREAVNSNSDEKNARKRETEILQKAEANSSPKFEELTSQSGKLESQNQIKKKRENRLTDAEFDKLRNTISKRNSMENVDMIENDLRGLLNDMGLIEDDLEENAEEMEKVRSVVNDKINTDETADNPVLSKGKIESSLNQNDYKSPFSRKKRTQVKSVANEEAEESSNSDAKTEEEHVDRRRSNTNSPIDEKRVIDVNFITKNREDKQLTAQNPQPGENRLRASDIPNKREAPVAAALHGKDRQKSMVKSKIAEAGQSTTESYSRYEERVAREIKNKIQMLKEEVQKELGALEEDNDEEDEDGESLGEPQRKKRFVANTLLDEEANNIDPNSNADSAELQPHVRRRRMLSTDLLDNTRDQEEPVNLKESISDFGDIEPSNSLYNMGNFEGESQGPRIVGDNLKAKMLSNQDKFMKEDVLKYVDINNDERIQLENDRNSWMRPQLHSKKSRDFYYPQFQKRSFLNYIPWNAVQKQSRNLNTGVYSYESESEGNSDSRPQPECKTNVELDTSKKTQQFKYNSQPFPKDRTAEKPGYYVYYLGKNQEKKLETPQSSELLSRRNRPMNYQQMRMTYPQFNDNINGLQNKEQYMTANNDDENQKSMTFRIMYKVPAGRRKKRQVTRNFFIPFKDTEDAIVTNTFSESIPGYVISNSKKKNSTNSNSDPTNKNIIDGDGSRSLKLKRFINNEKGEKDFSKDGKEQIDASDSNINTQVKSEKATDNYTNKTFYKIISEEDKKTKILESDQTDLKNNSTYKYLLRSSNLPMYKSLPTVEEMKNDTKYSLESVDSSSRSKDDIKVNSRRILSSTMNNEETAQLQNIENTTYSFNNFYFKVQTQKKSVNNTGGPFASNGGRQNDIEYEDVPISEIPIKASSINEVHSKTIKNRRIDTTSIKELPNLTDDRMNNFTTNLLEESVLIGDKVNKNNLYVPNEDYLPDEWKRRKRDIRLDSEDRDNARKKRLNWFWPIKSSYGQNTPQNEEYDQFESNGASDSGKENSERFKDSSAGVDNNYEDFSVDVGDYDRKKRQLNSFAPGNQKTYSYAGSQRLHYLPESGARRYVDGWYREPHRELLTDMSDVELFGALPQSYAGELNRYKRVKRGKWGRY